MQTLETIALEKKDQAKVTKQTKALKEKIKSGKLKRNLKKIIHKRGVVYIGHIPHGFYEEEMKEYFSQFGSVTNVRVCRSSRTGKSKGYGFVEFSHSEVAKIAAETMNNYIMFKRRLIAEYVPPEKRFPHLFSKKQITEDNYPTLRRRNEVVASKNKDIDDKTHFKRSRRSLDKLNKKMDKLKKYGIDYDLKPLDVPEGIETKENQKKTGTIKKVAVKKEENVDNSDNNNGYANDSLDSEIAYKVTETKSKSSKTKKPIIKKKEKLKGKTPEKLMSKRKKLIRNKKEESINKNQEKVKKLTETKATIKKVRNKGIKSKEMKTTRMILRPSKS